MIVIGCRIFGCKWTMALSFITYMPFILSNLYPRLYTMIPSGLAVGFGGGPMWCAKCTYLTVIAEALAIFNGKDSKSDTLIVRFFGLFFIFYQMAQVWGNLISSSGWLNHLHIFFWLGIWGNYYSNLLNIFFSLILFRKIFIVCQCCHMVNLPLNISIVRLRRGTLPSSVTTCHNCAVRNSARIK